MWLVYLLILANVTLSTDQINTWRVEAGFPINILDVLTALGVVAALFFNGHAHEDYFPTPSHPLLPKVIVLFVIATLGGLAGAMVSGADFRVVVTMVRNWLTIPITMWITFSLLKNPRATERLLRMLVIGGVITAAMILLFFFGASAAFVHRDSLNKLRTVAYVSPYAGITAAFLLYTVITGVRIFSTPVSIGLGAFCLLGQFATLSRSDWVPAIAALLGVYFLLPRGRRTGKIMTGLLVTPILFLGLLLGVYVASSLSGTDMFGRMVTRLETMLPGAESAERGKAWDTRLPAATIEVQQWMQSPITGKGFGIQDMIEDQMGRKKKDFGFRHIVWTGVLAEMGILGLAAVLAAVLGTAVVGRRLVLENWDRSSLLVGAYGALLGLFLFVQSSATGSVNNQRGAILLAVGSGLVLRARAMQALARQALAGEVALEPNVPGFPAPHAPGMSVGV